MKVTKAMLKHARTLYLYSDGHADVVYERQDPKAGKVEWVEMYEKFGAARCAFKGRIWTANRTMMKLLAGAVAVQATAPGLEHGSENTRKAGIAVGSLSVQVDKEAWGGTLHFYYFPNLISGEYEHQTEERHEMSFAEAVETVEKQYGRWGDYQCTVHREPAKAQEAA